MLEQQTRVDLDQNTCRLTLGEFSNSIPEITRYGLRTLDTSATLPYAHLPLRSVGLRHTTLLHDFDTSNFMSRATLSCRLQPCHTEQHCQHGTRIQHNEKSQN
jgi:hypothetical protein